MSKPKPRIRYDRMRIVSDIDIFRCRSDQGIAIQFSNTGEDGGKVVTIELPWCMVKQLREKIAAEGAKVATDLEGYAKFVRDRAGSST